MDDAHVERRVRGEVDDLVGRYALRVHELVDASEERTGLHLEHGVAARVERIHVLLALEERASHGDGLLVVEDAAVPEPGSDVAGGERVPQEERVSRVLVVDDAAQHHVADAPVERRRLAHDVDAAEVSDALPHAREQMVGRHPERVVDVDDDRVALREALDAGDPEPGIDELRIDLAELRDLRVDVDVPRLREVHEALRGLERAHLVHLLGVLGRVDVAAEQVVEEGSELGRVAGLRRAVDLGAEALGVLTTRPAHDLVGVALRVAADQVGDRVRVRRDEVDRRPARLGLAHVRGLDAAPPPLRRALVLRVRRREHPDLEIGALLEERPRAALEALRAQRVDELLRIVDADPERARERDRVLR